MKEKPDSEQEQGVDVISSESKDDESIYSEQEFRDHLSDEEGRAALSETLSSMLQGLEDVPAEELDDLSAENIAEYEDAVNDLKDIQEKLGEIPANEEEIQKLYERYDEAFMNAEHVLRNIIGIDVVYSESEASASGEKEALQESEGQENQEAKEEEKTAESPEKGDKKENNEVATEESAATDTIPEEIKVWVTNVNKRRTALRRRYQSLPKEQQAQLEADMEEVRTSDLRKEAPELQDRSWRLEFQKKMAQLERGIEKLEQERLNSEQTQRSEHTVEDAAKEDPAEVTEKPKEGVVKSAPEVSQEKSGLPDNEHNLIHEGWARWDEKISPEEKKSKLPQNENELIHEGWNKWDEKVSSQVDEEAVAESVLTPSKIDEIVAQMEMGESTLNDTSIDRLVQEMQSDLTKEGIDSLVAEMGEDDSMSSRDVLSDSVPQEDTEKTQPETTNKTFWGWVKGAKDLTVSSKEETPEKSPDSKSSAFEKEHIDGLKTKYEDAWDEYHDALRAHFKERKARKDVAESFGFRTKLPPEVEDLKEKYEKARTDYTVASYGRATRRLSTEDKFNVDATKERRAELERRYMSRLILKHVVHDAERVAQIKQEVLSEKKIFVGKKLLAKWQQYPKWARYGMTAGGGFGLAVATGVLPAVGVGASALIVGRRMAGSAAIGALSPTIAKGFSKLHERLFTKKKREADEQLKKSTKKTNFQKGGLRERLQSLSGSHERVERSEKRQRLTSTLGTAAVAGAAGAGLSSLDSLHSSSDNTPKTGDKPIQRSETPDTTEGFFPDRQEGDVSGSVTEPESASGVSPEGEEAVTYTLQEGGYEAQYITRDFLEKKYPELDPETRRIIVDKFNDTVPREMWERMGVPYVFTDIKPGTSITYTPEAQEFIDNIVKDVTAERGEVHGEGITTTPTPENQVASVSGDGAEPEPAPDRVVITPPPAGAEEIVPTFVPPGTPPTFEPFTHEIISGKTTWDSAEAYLEQRHPYLSFDDRQEITKYFLENYLPNNPEVREAMGLPENLSQIKPGTPINYTHEAQLWLYEAAHRVRSGNGVIEVNPDGTFRS